MPTIELVGGSRPTLEPRRGTGHSWFGEGLAPDVQNGERRQTRAGWPVKVSTSDRAAMVKDPKVQKVYEDIVKKVNDGLAHWESVKKVGVVAEEWSVEEGEMTPSMKLKRRVITEKYKDRIAAFYRDAPGE